MWEIFTIGYSSHTLQSFCALLNQYGITAVADVRSNPHSKFKPEFNRGHLTVALRRMGIAYVFLGDQCGARPNMPGCYIDGAVDFDILGRRPEFQQGIKRLHEGMTQFRVALMCAEKDPIMCHRMVLVSRHLGRISHVNVRHILSDGRCEEHCEAEARLLKLFDLVSEELPGFGRSYEERLDEAYRRQAERIAHHADEDAEETVRVKHA